MSDGYLCWREGWGEGWSTEALALSPLAAQVRGHRGYPWEADSLLGGCLHLLGWDCTRCPARICRHEQAHLPAACPACAPTLLCLRPPSRSHPPAPTAAADALAAVNAEHAIDGRKCEAKFALPEGKVGSARTTRIFVARIPASLSDSQFRQYFEQVRHAP
jgi:hypothetical protein